MYVVRCQERLARIEQELQADDEQRHLEARNKVRRIETAEQRRRAPVNDSEMVDEMFGFIDSQVVDATTEAAAPLAFKVFYSFGEGIGDGTIEAHASPKFSVVRHAMERTSPVTALLMACDSSLSTWQMNCQTQWNVSKICSVNSQGNH